MITFTNFKELLDNIRLFDEGYSKLSSEYITVEYDTPVVEAFDNLIAMVLHEFNSNDISKVYEYVYGIDTQYTTDEELYNAIVK